MWQDVETKYSVAEDDIITQSNQLQFLPFERSISLNDIKTHMAFSRCTL